MWVVAEYRALGIAAQTFAEPKLAKARDPDFVIGKHLSRFLVSKFLSKQ
jgi:hypothetical protein